MCCNQSIPVLQFSVVRLSKLCFVVCFQCSTLLYHPSEAIGSLALISSLSSCVPPSCAKLFLPGAFCRIIRLVLHEVTQCAFSNLGTVVHARPEGYHEVPSGLRCTLAASCLPCSCCTRGSMEGSERGSRHAATLRGRSTAALSAAPRSGH